MVWWERNMLSYLYTYMHAIFIYLFFGYLKEHSMHLSKSETKNNSSKIQQNSSFDKGNFDRMELE